MLTAQLLSAVAYFSAVSTASIGPSLYSFPVVPYLPASHYSRPVCLSRAANICSPRPSPQNPGSRYHPEYPLGAVYGCPIHPGPPVLCLLVREAAILPSQNCTLGSGKCGCLVCPTSCVCKCSGRGGCSEAVRLTGPDRSRRCRLRSHHDSHRGPQAAS